MAVDSIARGIAGSKADLINGKVPIDQIPGAAFDYVEGYYFEGAFYSDEEHTKVITPSTQKIYLDKPTDNIYRWTGSQYVLTSGVYVASATAPDNKELIWIDISDNNGLINKDDLSDSVFSNLALPYNPTSGTYDVGDWCINNKTLYECTTEIPVSEAWNPAHWTQHPVTDAMYVKPTSGVPYSDLSNSVQLSLDKADQAETDIDGIEAKIPTQASAQNQLGDKDFINSSIATNTANYISNNGQPFTSVAQLEAYTGTVTNNDYAFVTGTDASGNAYYDRYKATVSGSTVTWANEFRLNNSSFTAAQWAAITSGITSVLVSFLSAQSHETWTFTLDDLTTVTKEVVVWTSPQ